MKREELRHAMELLVGRVRLDGAAEDCKPIFDDLDRAGMIAQGIPGDIADGLAGASWWAEMIVDVEETAEYCEPGTPPDEVLEYARDVVREYFRKRFGTGG